MVVVAQLVRASDCGSEGRGFESHLPPIKKGLVLQDLFLFLLSYFLSKKFVRSLLYWAGF